MREAKLRTSASLLIVPMMALLATLTASAQQGVPMLINYQGLLSGRETGEPLEGTCDIVFRIYNDPTDTSLSALIWSESHVGIEVADGVFSVILGSSSALSATDFSGPDRWLEIEVAGETLIPRQRMTSVAYSIISEDSRLLDGKESSEFADAGHAHSGADITSGIVSEGRLDAAIARDSETDAAVTTHTGIANAHHDRYTDAEAVAAMGAKDNTNPLHHDKTMSFSELSDAASDAQIPATIARDTEVDSQISDHAAIGDAHHAKTTSFAGLTDTATDVQIPASIARDSEVMPTVLAADGTGSTLDADLLDGIDSTELAAAVHTHDGRYWRLAGNGGTSPGANFLGTTDNQALEIHVNNDRALRLEPATAPNLIGGHVNNTVATGARGATVSGGGEAGFANRVHGDFGTVGGGRNNHAGDEDQPPADTSYATISGGAGNTAIGVAATVGGGLGNRVTANYATIAGGGRMDPDNPLLGNNVFDHYGSIGGGGNNRVGSDDGDPSNATYSTVGGGGTNWATGQGATIGGGFVNEASGFAATIPGGDSNTASGDYATIGGGTANKAEGAYSTIAGGGPFDPEDSATRNRVTDQYGTVSGGGNNQAGDNAGTPSDANFATVGGGHTNVAGAFSSTVAGGAVNEASAGWAAIGGGNWNKVTDENGTVAGGNNNVAGDDAGTADDANYATVSGGKSNSAGAPYATIGGGSDNQILIGGYDRFPRHATIGGGEGNIIHFATINFDYVGRHGTIAGGYKNKVGQMGGTVGGGYENTADGGYSVIAGGEKNEVVGDIFHASIGGGHNNTVWGHYGTVPGGLEAYVRCYGQQAYASGGFDGTIGTAQTSLYVVRNQTTSSAPTQLFLDGSYSRMNIPVGSTWVFEALVVGRTQDSGEIVTAYSAAYLIRGVIQNAGGLTTMPGASVDVLYEYNSSWDAIAEADDTNDALVIKVTGGSTPMRWVASVRTTEVMFPQ